MMWIDKQGASESAGPCASPVFAADASEASEQLRLFDEEKEWVEPVIATGSLSHEGRVLHKALTRIAMDHVC